MGRVDFEDGGEDIRVAACTPAADATAVRTQKAERMMNECGSSRRRLELKNLKRR